MFLFKTINKNKSNHKGSNIICKFDRPSFPCSIKTFEYGIVLFPEMVVRVYNPLGMKWFQIAQFKGHFYITRHDPV